LDTHWFAEAIIYQVLIDRFSRGEPEDLSVSNCQGAVFCGGNIKGLISRLPYLQDLGINTIWVSPFNPTAAYHGYHITDFFGVDPHFGTLDTVRELIESCRERGMRLLMDFVANHVHKSHPIFKEALEDPRSVYRGWFHFGAANSYLSFLGIDELPKLNLNNSGARDYIVKAALFWLDQGFDGLRLDHAIGPPKEFWRQFASSMKNRCPGAVLIGEASMDGVRFADLKTISLKHRRLLWLVRALGIDASGLVMRQYRGLLDGALDFRFQNLMRRFIAQPRWRRPQWLLHVLLRKHYGSFPRGFFLPSFLDNHDMSRFLHQAGQDKAKLMRAARLQFIQDQAPIIYYGTEVGMTQSRPTRADLHYSDLEARQMMPWNPEDQSAELLAFYQSLIAQRKARRGMPVVRKDTRNGLRGS